jgi:hypothetical protein
LFSLAIGCHEAVIASERYVSRGFENRLDAEEI